VAVIEELGMRVVIDDFFGAGRREDAVVDRLRNAVCCVPGQAEARVVLEDGPREGALG
jgi:hypothetical protein